MAAYTIVASSVARVAGNSTVEYGVAGAALTAGQAVYRESSTNTIKLADANSATAEVRDALGITLHASAIGQPIAYQTGGDLDLGTTMVVGDIVVLGAVVAGDLAPASDLASGWYTTIMGIAITATRLRMMIMKPGIAHA